MVLSTFFANFLENCRRLSPMANWTNSKANDFRLFAILSNMISGRWSRLPKEGGVWVHSKQQPRANSADGVPCPDDSALLPRLQCPCPIVDTDAFHLAKLDLWFWLEIGQFFYLVAEGGCVGRASLWTCPIMCSQHNLQTRSEIHFTLPVNQGSDNLINLHRRRERIETAALKPPQYM